MASIYLSPSARGQMKTGQLGKTLQLILWWVRRLEDHLIQTSVNMNGIQKNHVLWRFSCEALIR